MAKTSMVMALVGLTILGGAHAGTGANSKAPMPFSNHAGSAGLKMHLGSEGIAWSTFLAMQTAAAEASRRGVKVDQCRIFVAEWGERLMVAFLNPDTSGGWQGCPPGPCLCLEVDLTKDGVHVLEAHFSR
jgi:hypothetical protein